MCTKLIKPSVPTPPHLRTLKQSPVDQVQNSVKTTVLLYYSADGSTGTDQEVERRRINLLETSLSETLTRSTRWREDTSKICTINSDQYVRLRRPGYGISLLSPPV